MELPELYARSVNGREARLILDHMAPILGRAHHNQLSQLKGLFRQGSQDYGRMMAMIGQLVAFDDIEIALRNQVTRGDNAQREIDELKESNDGTTS